MPEEDAPRRLATIVAVDVAGYSARTEADEDSSAREIVALGERVRAVCERHGGRVFNTAGDGFMLEFASVSAALTAGEELALGKGPPLRVGVHLGEVRVIGAGDLLGHGVNVAARLQALAPQRGVLASADVRRAVRGALGDRLVDRGAVRLDKMDETVRVFALAPEGASPVRKPRRRAILLGAAIGGAGLAAAAGYGGWLLLRGSRAGADPMIAVLPFDNLSPEPQLAFFADGLSEDILDALVRGGGLRVTSQASSFTFRGPGKARAGQALNVGYLLDGSVLRNGPQLRVNARLTDVARQQVVWSETYDRQAGEGLAVEDEIAAQVAAALRVQIRGGGARAAPAIDAVVYDLYLQGRQASRLHGPDSVARGGELLRQAVARDPAFAKAWYELASNYRRAIALEPIERQLNDAALGRQAAQRALALDPGNGAAYALLATLSPVFGRWEEVGRTLDKALQISPNDPDILGARGHFAIGVGRIGKAVEWARRAFALNPLDQLTNEGLASILTFAGRNTEAVQIVERQAAIWPGRLGAYWDRFWLLLTSGRDREAAGWLEDRARRPDAYQRQYEVFAAAVRAAAPDAVARREAAARDLLDLSAKGMGYACESVALLNHMGLPDTALKLARSIYLKSGELPVERNVQFIGSSRYQPFGEPDTSFLFQPLSVDLRRAGRLNDIFDGLGLSAYWRRTSPPDP